MRYYLSNLIVDENETVESLKQKISNRLLIPVTSFRYQILLKESFYSFSKLRTKVDLEIETSEFIRDTSLSFMLEQKSFSFVPRKLKNRPIIYGATLSGLYAGLYFARCGLNPIIVDPCTDFSSINIKGIKNSNENNCLSDPLFYGGYLDFSSSSSITSFLKKDIEERINLKLGYERYYFITSTQTFLLANSLKEEIISLGGEFYFSSFIKSAKTLFGNLKSVDVRTPEGIITFKCNCLFISLLNNCPLIKKEDIDTYLGFCFQNKERDVKNALYGNYRIRKYPLFIEHPDNNSSSSWINIFPLPSSLCPYVDLFGNRNVSLRVKEDNNLGYYSGILLKKLDKKDMPTSIDIDAFIYSLLTSGYRSYSMALPCSNVEEFLHKEEPYKMGVLKGDFEQGLFLSSMSSLLNNEISLSFNKKIYELIRHYPFFFSTSIIVSGFYIYRRLKPGVVSSNFGLSNCKGIYSLINENNRPMDVSNASFNGLKVAFDYLSNQY